MFAFKSCFSYFSIAVKFNPQKTKLIDTLILRRKRQSQSVQLLCFLFAPHNLSSVMSSDVSAFVKHRKPFERNCIGTSVINFLFTPLRYYLFYHDRRTFGGSHQKRFVFGADVIVVKSKTNDSVCAPFPRFLFGLGNNIILH